MVKIPLTKGKVAIVDDEFAHLSEWKWFVGTRNYVCRNFKPFPKSTSRTIRIHHCIVGYPLNGLEVDHINGNTLDNRRENLRIVTHEKNTQNKKCHRNGSILGVYFDRINSKWVAEKRLPGGGRLFFKRFRTQKEAHSFYMEETNGK